MANRYYSKNDKLQYSAYTTTKLGFNPLPLSSRDTIHNQLKQHLQQVVIFDIQKQIPIQKIQTKNYYIFGQINFQLSTFYDKNYCNAIRTDNTLESITFNITANEYLSQYSIFNKHTVLYYMLASEKYNILNEDTENYYWQNDWCIINHNLNGYIDFIIRDKSTGYEVYDIDHIIFDKNILKLYLPNFNQKQYEIIIWKIDQFDSKIYRNVFMTDKIDPYSVNWAIYNNTQEYQLDLNYKFSFIGYIINHDTPIALSGVKYDPSDINNLSTIINLNTNQLNPNSYTENQNYKIERHFDYILNDKQQVSEELTSILKVLLPNNQHYTDINMLQQCKALFVYSSILSETIYIEDNISSTIQINHDLNGIVKIAIRNVRNDLYKTKIIDNNTIEITFIKVYKLLPKNFFVDLFLIWSEDNNLDE